MHDKLLTWHILVTWLVLTSHQMFYTWLDTWLDIFSWLDRCQVNYSLGQLDTCQVKPPKNGLIALWPNPRVVKCKYHVSQKQNGFKNKIHWYSILLYSLLYLDSRRGFDGLKYTYSVISVIVDSLPGNTKNQESTRSWTAIVRLVYSWAEQLSTWHLSSVESSESWLELTPSRLDMTWLDECVKSSQE